MTQETYCDHCAKPLRRGEGIWIPSLPINIASANMGESAVLCTDCKEHVKPTRIPPDTLDRCLSYLTWALVAFIVACLWLTWLALGLRGLRLV